MSLIDRAREIAKRYWQDVPTMAERIEKGWEDDSALMRGIVLGLAEIEGRDSVHRREAVPARSADNIPGPGDPQPAFAFESAPAAVVKD